MNTIVLRRNKMQVSGVKLYVSHTKQTQDRDRDTKGTIQTEIEILQA